MIYNACFGNYHVTILDFLVAAVLESVREHLVLLCCCSLFGLPGRRKGQVDELDGFVANS